MNGIRNRETYQKVVYGVRRRSVPVEVGISCRTKGIVVDSKVECIPALAWSDVGKPREKEIVMAEPGFEPRSSPPPECESESLPLRHPAQYSRRKNTRRVDHCASRARTLPHCPCTGGEERCNGIKRGGQNGRAASSSGLDIAPVPPADDVAAGHRAHADAAPVRGMTGGGCIRGWRYSPRRRHHNGTVAPRHDYCAWGWMNDIVYQRATGIGDELLARVMYAATAIKGSRVQLRRATCAVHKRAANAEMQWRGKLEITEKTCRPAASSGTIPTCENPRVNRPGIEPGKRVHFNDDSGTAVTPAQFIRFRLPSSPPLSRAAEGETAITTQVVCGSKTGKRDSKFSWKMRFYDQRQQTHRPRRSDILRATCVALVSAIYFYWGLHEHSSPRTKINLRRRTYGEKKEAWKGASSMFWKVLGQWDQGSAPAPAAISDCIVSVRHFVLRHIMPPYFITSFMAPY
ncbi:hypothetical protein PR048_000692 [Dryococelus australis]|uniref:Uncharacterized protein n=1 Tax=Dryococelus australis TaxID=614101 RepID=A0ABQ9IGR6_9NEOP|nr:hypothetical protein PR048_000692 [Dryococelus australis]